MLSKVGNCRVVEEIGSGGMAVIYKAVQESLNRVVAIKALKTSVLRESQFAIRFEREALSLAQLQHENIVHVYDYLKESDHLFIVMEYVEGIDLYDLLEKVGQIPPDVAAIIAMQVARALDYAHYRGILHRDVKPANIMISRSGGVKLMDFGIARDQAFGDLTETGTGLGTPSYMSPEQILGEKLDGRSDQFSIGVVMYQMCTGKKPFVEDETKSVMHKIRLEKYVRPRKIKPEIPRELERIMARCMQKQARSRYRSTQELVLALERFLARRVDMNYHARLVLFLRNAGVITDEDAETYLHPSAIGGGKASGQNNGDEGRIVRMAQVEIAILGAMALAVSLIHLAPVGGAVPPAPPPQQVFVPMPAPKPKPRGSVQIVALPWAHVYVDGVYVDTTPTAAPLLLDAGARELTFRNPWYADVVKKVDIIEGVGKNKPLIVELKDLRAAPLGDPSPPPATLKAPEWQARPAPPVSVGDGGVAPLPGAVPSLQGQNLIFPSLTPPPPEPSATPPVVAVAALPKARPLQKKPKPSARPIKKPVGPIKKPLPPIKKPVTKPGKGKGR